MANPEKPKCACHQCQAMAEAVEAGATPEEALEQFQQAEQAKIAEHGWIVHFVGEDNSSPTGVNIHTHGFPENYGHPDLQIIIPLPPQIAHSILQSFQERVKDGEEFHDGDMVDEILHGFSVKMVSATECERTVLRVILPDQKGNLDSWSMEDPYLRQYGDLVELPELASKHKRTGWTAFKG